MIRRPPRSTLFPTRRSSDLRHWSAWQLLHNDPQRKGSPPAAQRLSEIRARSEEHTSELQSRLHLVCRLLLEKKKKQNNQHRQHPLCASLQSQLEPLPPLSTI